MLVSLLVAGSACGPGSAHGPAQGDRLAPEPAAAADRPVVEVAAAAEKPFLDPGAEPTTALGRLRARHLPVWTADFDLAFPPDVCDSAWELDAVAAPVANARIGQRGDIVTMAVLATMRYEYQLSRALADPSPLAQLCVAVASVDPARADGLDDLVSHYETGTRRSQAAAFPKEVRVVAVSPTSAVSVACVTPGYPIVVGGDEATIEPALSPSRLKAYLLSVSRGLEDQVTDISYRVSDTAHRRADDCGGLGAWTLEWHEHVQAWIAEGQIWEPLNDVLTAGGICDSPPPDGPDECPNDWPL